jgi:hypothetical protein
VRRTGNPKAFDFPRSMLHDELSGHELFGP